MWIKKGNKTVNLNLVKDIERVHRQKDSNYKEMFFIRFSYQGQTNSVEFNFTDINELDNYYANLLQLIEAQEVSTKKDPLI
jgi:hypothetical protein